MVHIFVSKKKIALKNQNVLKKREEKVLQKKAEKMESELTKPPNQEKQGCFYCEDCQLNHKLKEEKRCHFKKLLQETSENPEKKLDIENKDKI